MRGAVWGLVALLITFTEQARAGMDEAIAALQDGDYETALQEAEPLAMRGDAEAQWLLSTMYRHGMGVPQNEPEANRWVQRAFVAFALLAEQGDAEAQYKIGLYYSEGWDGGDNAAAGVYWLRQSARQANLNAMVMLGLHYQSGRGAVRNYGRSYALFNAAVGRGAYWASNFRDEVEELLDPTALAEAQALSTLWFENPSMIE